MPDLRQPCSLPLRYGPVELGPVPGVLTALRDKLKRHREVGASMIELSGHAVGRVGRAGDRPNCMATRVTTTRPARGPCAAEVSPRGSPAVGWGPLTRLPERGVAVEGVAALRVASGGPPALMLGFARLPEHRIAQAVRLLAEAITMTRPGGPPTSHRPV